MRTTRHITGRPRKLAFTVVPAVAAACVLAGCNEGAPGVQAPPSSAVTPSSTAAPSTTTEDSAPSTTTDSPSTDGGVPTTSATPSSSADLSKVCDPGTNTYTTPATAASGTKKIKWGSGVDITSSYQGTVNYTAEKPTSKARDADDIFGPKEGQASLLIKVKATYKSGEKTSLYDFRFTLRDPKGNVCDDDSISSVVPRQQRFDDATVDKTTKTYSGYLVFDVPAGQDYSKYQLLYAGSYGTKDATVEWTD